MSNYEQIFDGLGLRDWRDVEASDSPMSMAQLLAKSSGGYGGGMGDDRPFPSLDALHEACDAIPQTRDVTVSVEQGFLAIKDSPKFVLDPLTQPLSWMLEEALYASTTTPWWFLIPLLVWGAWAATRKVGTTVFVAAVFLFFGFIDHLDVALETLSIIFVCTGLSVLLGVSVGIMMSRSDRLQKVMLPIPDMLQTLPSSVYLIPRILLFSVAEPKLYCIAIILYAIVPVIRLTDLGIRLVDPDVIEAAGAFLRDQSAETVRCAVAPIASLHII